ncbi:MAG: adenylate cyclase [Patescibacteria group bacterium]
MEIEKKYKLINLPSGLENGEHIDQGYLLISKWLEIRIRDKAGQYFLTFKGNGTISRMELEFRIPKWIFWFTWPWTKGRRIEKIRYSKRMANGLVLEFDKYLGSLAGLIILEVEFPDEVSANRFIYPEDIRGVDVTYDKRYKNKNLALNGILE